MTDTDLIHAHEVEAVRVAYPGQRVKVARNDVEFGSEFAGCCGTVHAVHHLLSELVSVHLDGMEGLTPFRAEELESLE